MPFLRDMEVNVQPRVLVRGMRTEIRPEGGEGPCCPGRYRSHWYTHTHKESQLPPPHHPLLKVSVERQTGTQTLLFPEWTLVKAHTESQPWSSRGGGCACFVVLRLKNIWWDLLLTNQTIKPFTRAPQATF